MKVQKGHKEGWHDAGKKACSEIDGSGGVASVRGGSNAIGPKNAGGGGKMRGKGVNMSGEFDTMPSGYRRGK